MIPRTERTWFVIASLLFCNLFGLYFVWKNPRWTIQTKKIVTGVFLGICLVSVLYDQSPAGKREKAQEASQEMADAKREADQQVVEDAKEKAKEKSDRASQLADAQVSNLGDIGYVRINSSEDTDVPIARTEDDFKKEQDAIAAKDDVGMQQLENNGDVILVKQGTQAKLIGNGSGWLGGLTDHIRLVNGFYADSDGYIDAEFLKQNPLPAPTHDETILVDGRKLPADGHITRADFGNDWPLTVGSAYVAHDAYDGVTITINGKTYALNGIAIGEVEDPRVEGSHHRYPDFTNSHYWANDPNPALKEFKDEHPGKDIGPLITYGLALQKQPV